MIRIVRASTLARLRDAKAAGELDAAEAAKTHLRYIEQVARAEALEARMVGLRADLAGTAAALAETRRRIEEELTEQRDDAYAELADLPEAPEPEPGGPYEVAVYRRDGRISSVHVDLATAQAAGERDGADPDRWETPREVRASEVRRHTGPDVLVFRVEGEWPDRAVVWMLLDSDTAPRAVHGTAAAAGIAALEAYSRDGQELHIRPWSVLNTRLADTPDAA